jgi:hypothetical protein
VSSLTAHHIFECLWAPLAPRKVLSLTLPSPGRPRNFPGRSPDSRTQAVTNNTIKNSVLLIYFKNGNFNSMSRGSAVGIATAYGLDDRGVGVPSPARAKNIYCSMSSRLVLRPTQPPIQWVPGAPGVKRPGTEADHSPPTSAEVKKMWILTSTPPYAFTA